MKTYYDDGKIKVRSMVPEDAKILYDTYLSYGWHPEIETYESYYREQEEGVRLVFIAEYDGDVKGQCTLVLHPSEGPWGGKDIPEIVDLTVFFDIHGKGIGTKLLDVAESEASKISDTVPKTLLTSCSDLLIVYSKSISEYFNISMITLP